MSTAECPRCGRFCPVGAHYSAHCTACFTSFRSDVHAPERNGNELDSHDGCDTCAADKEKNQQ